MILRLKKWSDLISPALIVMKILILPLFSHILKMSILPSPESLCESCHGQAERLLDSAKEMEDSIAVNLSTAGHEASGTGSMKFLMNGCLLLANEKLVRIHGKTLQSPGRAISVAISQLKAKIPNIEKCLDVVATLQVRKGTGECTQLILICKGKLMDLQVM